MENSRRHLRSSRKKTPVHEFEDSISEEEINRRPRQEHWSNTRDNDPIKGVKLKIPTFQGKIDPEAYMEWKVRIEMVFNCHN